MPDIWVDVDTALSEVPINKAQLIDDGDFKSREESVTYNQAGLDLVWNFITTSGAFTQTAVTPTDTGGNYDWVNQGNGFYTIEIPASGGASINNDTEGVGWFAGFATGILPWVGPTIGFRASGLNDKLIDSAYSTTRGLAGTAVPDAAAGAAGGLPTDSAGKTAFNDIAATAIVSSGAITTSGGAVSTVTTATNVTTVNGLAANVITAASIANGAIDAATFAADVDAEILSYVVDDATRIDASALNTASATTIPAISAIFTGITSLAQWLGLIAGKQTGNSTARTELRATGGGSGTYDETTDSLEANRDNIGTAGAGLTAADDAVITAIGALSIPTAAANADAVWDEATSGHTTSGTFGEQLKTDVDAILADTGTDGVVVASHTTAAKAEINAEVLDVLNTDTFAEPGQGSPAATASLVAKLGYLYKAWRNRSTQTSSEYALYADDAITKDQEAAVSDNGTTYDRGEVTTGA